MNNSTRIVLAKVALFFTPTCLAIVLALLVVEPTWLAFVAVAVLLGFSALVFSSAPAGTGHVFDGFISNIIMAVLLLLITTSLGRILVPSESNRDSGLRGVSTLKIDNLIE